MWYKPYGSTGKDVSVIGFGAMRFQRIKADVADYDLDACAEVVLEARRRGINYFDTAPYYCDDRSEDIIGHSFNLMKSQGLGRPGEPGEPGGLPVYVSTKSSERDGAKLRAQLENSLRRLNLPRVTFFNIWCVLSMEDFESRMVKGGAYEAALQAKAEGLVEHVVFSTHCSGKETADILDRGLFDGVTLGYNILNWRFREEGLTAALRNRVGVVTMNPLGGGLIPQRAEKLGFLRSHDDDSVVSSALRFNGSHKEITVVLAGMGSVDEVRQNTAVGEALGRSWEKDPAPVALDAWVLDRKRSLKATANESMDTLCTGCQYCLPCPKDIPIPKYLQSYNESLFGEPKNTLGHLKNHWGIKADPAGECISCGVCEERCTRHLPIIDRLAQIVSWAGEV